MSMDMSGGLYTLPSEALSILKFFTTVETEAAHAEAIIEGSGLTDRGFGKGIRRLVTRNYLTLSGEQVYRLTEQGRRAVRELADQVVIGDDEALDIEDIGDEPRFVRRRLILVTPAALPADQPVNVVLGFDDAEEDPLDTPSRLLLRLGVLNGEPARAQEISFSLSNTHVQHSISVTAGAFTHARLRAEVFQFADSEEDVEFCGGMYVDLPVQRQPAPDLLSPQAYGIDVILREISV